MCNEVQLYAKGHEDTCLYAVVCGVALWTGRVLLARRLLDKGIRHAIEGDIPKFGEWLGHVASQESPHEFSTTPAIAHASLTHWTCR